MSFLNKNGFGYIICEVLAVRQQLGDITDRINILHSIENLKKNLKKIKKTFSYI